MRLEQARLTLQRNRALRADGIVNQADLDNAETEVRALEARLALSEEQVRVSRAARWRCARTTSPTR